MYRGVYICVGPMHGPESVCILICISDSHWCTLLDSPVDPCRSVMLAVCHWSELAAYTGLHGTPVHPTLVKMAHLHGMWFSKLV